MANTTTLTELIRMDFSEIAGDVVAQLKKENRDYLKNWEKILTLTEQFPVLVELFNGEDTMHLTAAEHNAFKDYLTAKGLCEIDEKEAYYFKGHADAYDYFKKIGVIP